MLPHLSVLPHSPLILIEFRCRRAKEKRLTKDAGRSRWGEYFKSLKGTSGGGEAGAKSNDSDRESEIDLDFAPCELSRDSED